MTQEEEILEFMQGGSYANSILLFNTLQSRREWMNDLPPIGSVHGLGHWTNGARRIYLMVYITDAQFIRSLMGIRITNFWTYEPSPLGLGALEFLASRMV